MKCSNCQNEVNDNDKFCSRCGTPITLLSETASDFPYPAPLPPEQNISTNGRTNNNQMPTQISSIFKGRMNRWRYFISGILLSIIYRTYESAILSQIENYYASIFVNLLFLIIFYLLCVYITTLRLHDMDKSGWWALPFYVFLIFIVIAIIYPENPIILSLFVILCIYSVFFKLFLLFKKGTKGPNRFGLDPLKK
ncbi:MAG: DUF805 domain-containing protein [Opitutales bacterium]|nr:DUF805 domain-containing protein [Opitutales bacterium]